MQVRKVQDKDLNRVNKLLYQVNNVHADGRPDLFIHDKKKYTDSELLELFKNDNRPIFVCVDDQDFVLGYAFCVLEAPEKNENLVPHNSIYIDDICVDSDSRRMGVGTMLFEYVLEYAQKNGFDRITLNVWKLNEAAQCFYESCGMNPLKVTMEKILY